MSASSNDAQHEVSREEDVSGVSAPVTRPGDSASRRPIRPSVSMIRSRRDDETAADGEVALVAELADGDRERALGELQRRYGAPLYGLGMRLLGDRGMAEELVQDTFVRLWRSAGRYDPAQSSVRTFLYTLARRAAVDLHRRSASRPFATATDGDAATFEPASAPFDDDAFHAATLAVDVRDAMSSLSPKHRGGARTPLRP